jgi:hypothetical protein
MTETITTIADAANSPTPPGPLTQRQAEPTRHDGSPRPGVISDAAYDQLDPAAREKFARVRQGPQGGSEWRDRSTLSPEAADPAAKPGTTPAPGDATVTPDGRLQVGEMLLSQDDIKSLIAEKAQADLRKTMVPDKPESYAAELPKEFKLPEGIEYKFDTNSPILADARNWAHSQGLTQQQFSQLLSFHANTQIAEQVMVGNAAKVEVEKLGAHGTARVTAVDTWLRGTLGDDLGKAVRNMMLTAKAAEGIEKIMTKMTGQGVASYRNDGREPQGAQGRVSEAEYNAMTPGERYTYSKSLPQSQFNR